MNAVLTIVYADVPGFPAGTVLASISASISDTATAPPVTTTQTVSPGTSAVTFANVAAGDYKFTVFGQDSTGNMLGSPVNGSFTITAPATVTLSLPATVTATQT